MTSLLMFFLFILIIGAVAGNGNLRRDVSELRKQVEELKHLIANANAAKQLKKEQPNSFEREKVIEVPPPPLIPNEDNAAP